MKTQTNKMKTLKNFLNKHHADDEIGRFAKNLTLKQFLETCHRGEWILWLFSKTNPDSLRELTLAKGRCANIIRHLIRSKIILKAIDTAIAFGEGCATAGMLDAAHADTREDYDEITHAAYVAAHNTRASIYNQYTTYAVSDAAHAAYYAADRTAAYHQFAAAYAARAAHDVIYAATHTFEDAAYAACYAIRAKKRVQKQTADICHRYLPLKIWNQSEI